MQYDRIIKPHCANLVSNRVCMGPGQSWNFIVAFSRTGKSRKKTTDPGKFYKYVDLK